MERDRQGVMRFFQGNVMKPVEGMPTEAADRSPRRSTSPPAPPNAAETPEPEVVDGDVLREVDAPPIIDVEESPRTQPPASSDERASWPSPSNAEGCRRREAGEGEEASQGSRVPRKKAPSVVGV